MPPDTQYDPLPEETPSASPTDAAPPSEPVASPLVVREREVGTECVPLVEEKSKEEEEEEEEGEQDPPIDRKAFAALGVTMLVNSMSFTILFPFQFFMVRDFGIEDEKKVGYYAGMVVSSFMVGRAISALFWGRMADIYGRKPVTYIGLVSVIICSAAFGFSMNLWMAVASRFVMGLFSSLVGIGKTVASELAPPKHHARAMSIISTTWGIGNILGPSLGGLLSGTWRAWPYAPPMLLLSGLAFVALVGVVFYLPETLATASGPRAAPLPMSTLVKSRPVVMSVAIYAIWSLQATSSIEMFNLWPPTSEDHGGLGMGKGALGTLQSISGGIVLLSQAFLVTPLAKRLGLLRGCKVVLFAVVPVLAAMPFLHSVPAKYPRLVASGVMIALLNVLTGFLFTFQFLLINNSCHSDLRATAQGLAMSMASVAKAVGPLAFSSLFAWSIHIDKFPIDYHLSWYALILVTVAVVGIVHFSPPSLDFPPSPASPQPAAEAEVAVEMEVREAS